MLALFETPAGFALFKVLQEDKLNTVEELWKEFQSPDAARKAVQLVAFQKFDNTAEALGAVTALVESKLSKSLRKFLKKEVHGETLAIADSKLGRIISDKLEINCVHNGGVMELMRGLRLQIAELITGLHVQDIGAMSLGLSHSLSRFKLKFSPDKVDTMIVQAIGLLDDLDKELNTYAMRVREWYGWHFPELGKIVQDNIQYAKVVKLAGSRVNVTNLDFSAILAEEIEVEMKEAALISMGTEVSEQDMTNIIALCEQVISLADYRGQLYDYLRSRMVAIAPNLTTLVGELVGARLIAHAGSLINLAKQPASTVQILGAEKALFRALKTKHETPKYGLIYHASLIGQAPPKYKGKISRVLAAKSALSIRVDALGEEQGITIGLEGRLKVEERLRQLEGKALKRISGASKGAAKIQAYDKDRKADAPGLLTSAKTYNPAADFVMDVSKPSEKNGTESVEEKETKKKKKKREVEEPTEMPSPVADEEERPKKKKKAKAEEVTVASPSEQPVKSKKKDKADKVELVEEEPEAKGKKTVDGEKTKKRKVVPATEEAVTDAANGAEKKKKQKKKKQSD